ncbi:MAG: hypothetical protein MZV64_15555 [Ignavibacteriales bacterium]|nr:hypothetical protein [Ignavibacteriales bacterium]
MIDVPGFNECGTMPHEEFRIIRIRLSQGTLHHIFKGGWLWIIPFNNHPAFDESAVQRGLATRPASISPAR